MDLTDLEAFYRATTFLVDHPGGQNISIRVGQQHSALDEIITPLGATWAFLTAANPRSIVLTESENAARNSSLIECVSAAGYPFWPGSGISDYSDWKPEESLLVVGMSKDESDRFAQRYDQNAFVYGEVGGVAELVWTRAII